MFRGNGKGDKRKRRQAEKKRFSMLLNLADHIQNDLNRLSIHLHSFNSRLVDFQFRLIQYSNEGWRLWLWIYTTWKNSRIFKRGTAVTKLLIKTTRWNCRLPPLAVELTAQALLRCLCHFVLHNVPVCYGVLNRCFHFFSENINQSSLVDVRRNTGLRSIEWTL